MSVAEWEDLPWWEARLLLDGFKEEGIIGNDRQGPATPMGGIPAQRPTQPDITSDDLSAFRGFTTRRAG